jgi:eukaryotic-like serine/threonine-protein kinase
MNRCPACGKIYGDEARFCTRDGSKLVVVAEKGTTRETVAGRAEPPTAVTHGNLSGRVLDGRYRIERKVGEGGMSFVYLAKDVASDEQYAIKVLSAALSSDANAMARLRREASLGMRLAHPNVCHIIRLGETSNGLVYVVMPFVEGEILSDRNNRLGTIPLAEVVPFVRDIAAGLHVAHELKIVHRDLKPENVMICANPTGGERAVVMDFGLAKERRADAELQKLTATGIILGTPEFMSPEQIRGKPLDGRSDVYALAILAFELFTGQLPFTGKSAQETMIARLRGAPLRLRDARPDLPAKLEAVITKALAVNPAERYGSMTELAHAFDSVMSTGVLGRLFRR